MNCSQNQPDPSVDSSLSRNDVENLAMKEGWTWIPPLDLPDHILQMSLLERAAWFEEYLLANVIGDVAAACTPKKDQTASSPSHPPACSLFFDCEITPPPDNVRVVFFIMPYRVWWFGKMMYGEICMPTAPPKAKAIYWIPLPLVPESPDTDRWEITESMKVRKA